MWRGFFVGASQSLDDGFCLTGLLLDNLRYAVDVCIYAFPNSSTGTSSPCALDQTCGPLKDSLEAGLLQPEQTSEYQYCSVQKGDFQSHAANCAQCLQSTAEQKYLSNCESTQDLRRMSKLTTRSCACSFRRLPATSCSRESALDELITVHVQSHYNN
jgi:hypothetical protein